jgi:hypothetical protein
MIIQDRVYGRSEITEPVLRELLESAPVQRMKGIAQFLPWSPWKGYARYDHCVGVMLLLRRVGASLEEQIAGLAHDVSHMAFSHVIDVVMGDTANEEFGDRTHASYVARTALPAIVRKHGLDERCVLHPHTYSLLEQPAPALCADRVDYTLREAMLYDEYQDVARAALTGLVGHGGFLVFNNQWAAEQFFSVYKMLQQEHWGSPCSTAYFRVLANAVKAALDAKEITGADLYQDDAYVIARLRASQQPVVRKSLGLLDNGPRVVHDAVQPEYVFRKKFRYVDTAFLEGDRVRTISEVHPDYAAWRDAAIQYHKEGIPTRIEPA